MSRAETLRGFQARLTAADRTAMERQRPMAGENIVITGRLADSYIRRDAITLLEGWGATIHDEVTRGTTLLVDTEPARSTAKTVQARLHGTLTLNEAGLVERLYSQLDVARAREEGAAPPVPFDVFVDTIGPLTDLAD